MLTIMMLQDLLDTSGLKVVARRAGMVLRYQDNCMQSLQYRLGFSVLITALLSLCAGCTFTGQLPVPTLPKFSSGSLTYYHSYGDSITYGFELEDRLTQAYPALISAATGIPLTNLAIPAEQSCDVPRLQIFANADAPVMAKRGLYSLLISTNDVDHYGIGAYETVFNLCHQASIAWLALPSEYKVLATSSMVTTQGPVTFDTSNNWNALVTDAQDASITFAFDRQTDGPVYVWYRIIDGNPGTFEYSLDGSVIGSGTTATTPAMLTWAGTRDSLALLRLPMVTAGPHTLTFTQTSAGVAGFAVTAVGLPPGEPQTDFPRVLVGTTPRQEPGSTCSHSDDPCSAYIADITANVNLFAGDSLDVEVFDSRKYTTGTGEDMLDALHPNALGHYEVARSMADVLK